MYIFVSVTILLVSIIVLLFIIGLCIFLKIADLEARELHDEYKKRSKIKGLKL